MTGVELIVTHVLRVPQVVGCLLQIGRTFLDGMLVEAVEAGLVDDIDDGLLGLGDGER